MLDRATHPAADEQLISLHKRVMVLPTDSMAGEGQGTASQIAGGRAQQAPPSLVGPPRCIQPLSSGHSPGPAAGHEHPHVSNLPWCHARASKPETRPDRHPPAPGAHTAPAGFPCQPWHAAEATASPPAGRRCCPRRFCCLRALMAVPCGWRGHLGGGQQPGSLVETPAPGAAHPGSCRGDAARQGAEH